MLNLVTLGDIARKLGGVSRGRADEISRRKTFPAPLGRVGRYRVWREDEVDMWIATYRRPRPGDAEDSPRDE